MLLRGILGQMIVANERRGVRDRDILKCGDERGESALITGLGGPDQCNDILSIMHEARNAGTGGGGESICMII
jgi:hypothetical protein